MMVLQLILCLPSSCFAGSLGLGKRRLLLFFHPWQELQWLFLKMIGNIGQFIYKLQSFFQA